jgi:hypothetical protein
MVRKMAAHGGRAIGASDKHNEPAGKGEELKGALKRKLEGGDEKEKKDEKNRDASLGRRATRGWRRRESANDFCEVTRYMDRH